MKINKKKLGISAFLATTLGTTVIASAFAALPVDQASTTTVTHKHHGFKRSESDSVEHKTQMAQALANALGTTVQSITDQLNAGKSPNDIIKALGLDEKTVQAQLEATHEADMKTHLQADVASGKLTQAQADEMLTNMKNHKDGEGKDKRNGKMNDQMLVDVATTLGTTKDALQAQLTAGKTMKDIIAASGVSESDFKTKMEALRLTELKTKLATDVSSGKLTQTQADQKLTDMQNHKGSKGKNGHHSDSFFSKKTSTENN